jgi:hypothetical protein
MFRPTAACAVSALILSVASADAEDSSIRVRADRPLGEVSPDATGLCIEDVNHEIYGGIDSQMIFGESFQEPPASPLEGFTAYGGAWVLGDDGVLHAAAGDGPKLLADLPPLAAGEVSAEVRFPTEGPNPPGGPGRLAGLIVKVGEPGVGADRFRGYEISLDPGRQVLLLGRHRQNWEPIREVSCSVPIDEWVRLTVRMAESALEIDVAGRPVTRFEDAEHPLAAGAVGLRTWRRGADFRNLIVTRDGKAEPAPFRADPAGAGVSGMWRAARRGTAEVRFSLETDRPYHGIRSQRITFEKGEGELGIENRGLNHRGMSFVADKPYEGYLWLRADQPATVRVALENGDGSRRLAEGTLRVDSTDWKRYDFTLTPNADEDAGCFAVTLSAPGSVVAGYAFLQPGPWGRFHDLPVRRDIAEGLIRNGVTVMRMGGLMANATGYRWKAMTGPRDRREPYEGYWYPYSSRGWGPCEFLAFCEAAEFLAIPDLNIDESPQDLADFVEYANGPVESEWGEKRAADGHPQPYRLRHIELGNEEAVDETYWRKFEAIAKAVWAEDPQIILIVGDFEYRSPITDPLNFQGAPRITSLAAHQKILDLAKEHGREVWFDVHIWNDSPGDAPGRIAALASFDSVLARLSPGASYKLCVLEENSGNHAVRRALAHAETVHGLIRMADRVPVVCAANALQPDRQNDNGWDQGFLFLNAAKVWAQPPLYVTRMISTNRPAKRVEVETSGAAASLDVLAFGDGETACLLVANTGNEWSRTRVAFAGLAAPPADVSLTQLTGPLEAANGADDPDRVVPWERTVRADEAGRLEITFPSRSYSVVRPGRR